jgi:ATP-dependent RNA helicase DeaD
MNAFEAIGLNEALVKATADLGFTTPTEIQEKAIPILLSGTTDFVGLAQTGTGKTAAFGMPLLQLIDTDAKYPQALIVCPTRELCLQITNDIRDYKKHLKGVSVEPVYGGASIMMQIKALKAGVQIVVATPGRLIDMIERKAVNLEKIKYVVLDEADEMLNMGFRDDIEFVLKNAINRESIWLFSATMPNEVRAIAKNFMKTPKEITVGKKNTGNVNIDHQYYITASQNRYETLKRLIDFNPGMYGIVFCRTRLNCQEVTEKLVREGYDIEALHGDLTQQQRDKVMLRFRQKSLQLIVATDVAARGIDVEGITHVINYELPDEMEVYTHRSGRTARAGKSGICISLLHTKEVSKVRHLERMVNAQFHKMDIPSGSDVCRKQFFNFMDKLVAVDVTEGEFATYMPALIEKFANLSKEDILQKVATVEFKQLLKYYENAYDLNARTDGKRDPSYGGHSGFTKLFVNLGTKDGFQKGQFLQFILDETGLKKEVLGRIDLRETNTFFEVDSESAALMIKTFDGKDFDGRPIRMNDADSGGPGGRTGGSSGGGRYGGGGGGSREGYGRDRSSSDRSSGGGYAGGGRSSGSSSGSRSKYDDRSGRDAQRKRR